MEPEYKQIQGAGRTRKIILIVKLFFMKGITRAYLLHLIKDCITVSIHHRRNVSQNYFAKEIVEITEDEMIDFITSIPYYTVELKDFLIGNLSVQVIIISQHWEKDFIAKGITWATDTKWTAADMSFLSNCYKNVVVTDFLSLPY